MQNTAARKKMIAKTFSAIFALLISFLLVLSSYTYYATRSAIINSISAQNHNLTVQANIFAQQFYKMVRSYGINVFNSRAIKRLRTDDDLSNSDYIESMRILKSDASSADYIHSIYVYAPSSDYIYCTLDSDYTRGAAPADSFFDEQATEMLKSSRDSTPAFRRINTGGHEVAVVSFPFYAPNADSGGMIINVSLTWMKHFISTVFGLDNTFLFFSSTESSADTAAIAPLLEKDGSFPEELFSGDTDYIIKNIDGEKCIIFGAANTQLNWYFARIMKYNDCMSAALSLRRNLIVLTVIMAAVSAGIFIYLFKKLYEPLEMLAEALPTHTSSVDQALFSASSELKKNSAIIRSEFLKKLVLFGSDGCSADTLRARGISLDPSAPTHMILFASVISQDDMDEILSGTTHECVPISERKVILLQSDAETFSQTAKKISHVSSFCAFDTGISFQALHDSYAKLDDIYSLRFFLPEKEVYTADVLDGREETKYPLRLENRITASLSSGNTDKAMQLFNEFIAVLSNSALPATLHAHLKQLYCSIAAMGDFEKSDIDSGTYYDMCLASLTCLDDLKNLFAALFARVAELSMKHREQEEIDMVNRVRKFVEDNFFDINLSTLYIAESEGVSVNYLCDIFKRYDENTLQKYITQYRLDRSCELLRSTNMPVTGIAQAVGFATPQYFFTVFKSYYNMTPATYREQSEKAASI